MRTTPNSDQQEAIQTTEGPLLIIAGPGSGKTFTLIERIYHLISEKDVPPKSIFVSTYTKKATADIITRLSSKLEKNNISVNLNEMYIGTLHSICLRFLEENRDLTRLNQNFTFLDECYQQYFIYQRLHYYQELDWIEHIIGTAKKSLEDVRTLMEWVNKVGEEALNPETLLNAPEPQVRVLGRCYQQYQTHLTEANCLDFSTIQTETLRLLTEHPDVLQKLRRQIRYLMVDEYQDTNTIQEQILFKLAAPENNLCVVGDDDQALYRFRGATVRNILEFPQKFPDGTCQQVSLTTNYRSHPDIIRFYNDWMESKDWTVGEQAFRHEKTMVATADTDFTEMPTVLKVVGDPNLKNWHDEVHAFLVRLKESGAVKNWNQVAFLFSSVKHWSVIGLAKALAARGIPVYSPRSNLFFERDEVRLMIGALISVFPQFREVRKWHKDANLPIWKYYDKDCSNFFETELGKPENADLLEWCEQYAGTHRQLAEPTDYGFSELFYQLLGFPLFSRYLGDDAEGGVVDSRPARNLAIFSQFLNKYEHLHQITFLTPNLLGANLQQLFNQFLILLKDGDINEYQDDSEYAPSGFVSFMTIHQAKGLEFPVVLVDSLQRKPWEQSTNLDKLLQTRYYSKPPFEPVAETKNYDFWRLFYTAFSRAQNLLLLTCQQQTEEWPPIPSSAFRQVCDDTTSWRDPAFQPESLTLETVEDADLKNEYSFSDIAVFEKCARQYKFYHALDFTPDDRNAFLFGTLVHQTIEDIHKAVLQGEAHRVTEGQIIDWFTANYTHLPQHQRTYLDDRARKAALKQVMNYERRERNSWDRLRDTEVSVSLVKAGYILNGRVDLIRSAGDTIDIVDFKTGRKPDLTNDHEQINQHRRQLEAYAHLIAEQTGQRVSKLHLYYTGEENSDPYVSFDVDASSINRTIATFDSIVERIENRDFHIAARPYKLCLSCDMRSYCDALE